MSSEPYPGTPDSPNPGIPCRTFPSKFHWYSASGLRDDRAPVHQRHIVIVLGGKLGKLCLNVEKIVQKGSLNGFDIGSGAIVFNLNVVGNDISHPGVSSCELCGDRPGDKLLVESASIFESNPESQARYSIYSKNSVSYSLFLWRKQRKLIQALI